VICGEAVLQASQNLFEHLEAARCRGETPFSRSPLETHIELPTIVRLSGSGATQHENALRSRAHVCPRNVPKAVGSTTGVRMGGASGG
jgi:hypothetical protein